ncbi:hypothetical protein QBC45DRAFT_392079 [Copromyces sp. CBS 386.78]|nr:hypothetical protein QBC45DRAFT_392079 [Copromyces sp. CBS 386.78]
MDPFINIENLENILHDANEQQRAVYWAMLYRVFDFIRRTQIQHAKVSSAPLLVFPTASDFLTSYDIVPRRPGLAANRAQHEFYEDCIQMDALLEKTSDVSDFKEEVASDSVDNEASNPANDETPSPTVTRIINPIGTFVDFLAAREWCRRRACVKARQGFGQRNGTDDIPLDQATQKRFAGQLSLAAMNEAGTVDNLYHGKPGKKVLNYIIKRLRVLPTLAVSLLGWEALSDMIDSHIGIAQVPIYARDLEIKPYPRWTDRYDKMMELITAKISNQSTNSNRAAVLQIGAEELAQLITTRKNELKGIFEEAA